MGFFALHAGAFITAHLFFLWIFFSHAWLKKVHGVGSFFYELLGANYVCAALVFLIIASGVSFLIDSAPQSQPVSQTGKTGDAVGAIVGGLYVRIVIMQVAIIFGAMIAGMSGSLAPLLIVIGLKTLIDVLASDTRGGAWRYSRAQRQQPPAANERTAAARIAGGLQLCGGGDCGGGGDAERAPRSAMN